MGPNYRIPTNTFKSIPLPLSDQFGDDGFDSDSNKWISADQDSNGNNNENDDDGGNKDDEEDWEETLQKRNDGSLWSSFESSHDDDEVSPNAASNISLEDYDDGETFLDAIASITADEIEFMNTEADRADKVRQMQEWGFNSESIANTLGGCNR